MAAEYGFQYEFVTYKFPPWLRAQTEKQRIIWAYKILFLDVLFPLDLDKIIFVDADQIVRVDMKELVDVDLHGRVYGMAPMGDSREEMEGFRFWKQGYWRDALRGRPYHIRQAALHWRDILADPAQRSLRGRPEAFPATCHRRMCFDSIYMSTLTATGPSARTIPCPVSRPELAGEPGPRPAQLDAGHYTDLDP